jgi:hypothetical protein
MIMLNSLAGLPIIAEQTGVSKRIVEQVGADAC